jgi:hypothetical protein
MRDMLMNNEFQHSDSSTSTERERLEREIREASAPPAVTPRPDRRLKVPQSERLKTEMDIPKGERSVAPRISSAPMSSPTGQMQQHGSGTNERQKLDLKGSATLNAKGGAEIGTLSFDLETT